MASLDKLTSYFLRCLVVPPSPPCRHDPLPRSKRSFQLLKTTLAPWKKVGVCVPFAISGVWITLWNLGCVPVEHFDLSDWLSKWNTTMSFHFNNTLILIAAHNSPLLSVVWLVSISFSSSSPKWSVRTSLSSTGLGSSDLARYVCRNVLRLVTFFL